MIRPLEESLTILQHGTSAHNNSGSAFFVRGQIDYTLPSKRKEKKKKRKHSRNIFIRILSLIYIFYFYKSAIFLYFLPKYYELFIRVCIYAGLPGIVNNVAALFASRCDSYREMSFSTFELTQGAGEIFSRHRFPTQRCSADWGYASRNNGNYATVGVNFRRRGSPSAPLPTANIGPGQHNVIHSATWRFVNFD